MNIFEQRGIKAFGSLSVAYLAPCSTVSSFRHASPNPNATKVLKAQYLYTRYFNLSFRFLPMTFIEECEAETKLLEAASLNQGQRNLVENGRAIGSKRATGFAMTSKASCAFEWLGIANSSHQTVDAPRLVSYMACTLPMFYRSLTFNFSYCPISPNAN